MIKWKVATSRLGNHSESPVANFDTNIRSQNTISPPDFPGWKLPHKNTWTRFSRRKRTAPLSSFEKNCLVRGIWRPLRKARFPKRHALWPLLPSGGNSGNAPEGRSAESGRGREEEWKTGIWPFRSGSRTRRTRSRSRKPRSQFGRRDRSWTKLKPNGTTFRSGWRSWGGCGSVKTRKKRPAERKDGSVDTKKLWNAKLNGWRPRHRTSTLRRVCSLCRLVVNLWLSSSCVVGWMFSAFV